MMGYDYNDEQSSPITSTNDLLGKVFFRMFLGLLATAIAAAYTFYSETTRDLINSNAYSFLFVAEIIVVIAFSFGFRKFSSGVVTALFFTYAILTGVTFSTLFVLFQLQSIVYAFGATALLFGILAYIGKTTTKDLSKFGTILMVTLLVGLIVSLVNIFARSSMVDIVLDWVILFIFMGFTVYDINKIVNIQNEGVVDEDKLYVYGAMELYLDFINIFLRILYLFGNRRD